MEPSARDNAIHTVIHFIGPKIQSIFEGKQQKQQAPLQRTQRSKKKPERISGDKKREKM